MAPILWFLFIWKLFSYQTLAIQDDQMTSIATLSTLTTKPPALSISGAPLDLGTSTGVDDHDEIPLDSSDEIAWSDPTANQLSRRQGELSLNCKNGLKLCVDEDVGALDVIEDSPFGVCTKDYRPVWAHFQNKPFTICCAVGIGGNTKRDPENTLPEYGGPGWKCCRDTINFRDCDKAASVVGCLDEYKGKHYNITKGRQFDQDLCVGAASKLFGFGPLGLILMLAFWALFFGVCDCMSVVKADSNVHGIAADVEVHLKANELDTRTLAGIQDNLSNNSDNASIISPEAKCEDSFTPVFHTIDKQPYTICCPNTHIASTIHNDKGFGCCNANTTLLCERAHDVKKCINEENPSVIKDEVDGLQVCKGKGDTDPRVIVEGLGIMAMFWAMCIGGFLWVEKIGL